MSKTKCKALILTAISKAIQSLAGRSNASYPSRIRKATMSTINVVLHQWKQYANPHLFLTLRLWPRFRGQAEVDRIISEDDRKESRAERAKFLLEDMNFLKDAQDPGAFHFSAKFFHDLVADHLFVHPPRLGEFVDRTAPQHMLDNLFALGAAAIAASVREWVEGDRVARTISPEMWRDDYRCAKECVRRMRSDGAKTDFLDDLQSWMMKQG